jgi:hypothetical protein
MRKFLIHRNDNARCYFCGDVCVSAGALTIFLTGLPTGSLTRAFSAGFAEMFVGFLIGFLPGPASGFGTIPPSPVPGVAPQFAVVQGSAVFASKEGATDSKTAVAHPTKAHLWRPVMSHCFGERRMENLLG